MSKINSSHIFTSESVSEGHPDKIADAISDAILDACLMQDEESRVACEVMVTTNRVIIAGELRTNAIIDFEQIARNTIKEIGYNDKELLFSYDDCVIENYLHEQSNDIALGVDKGSGLDLEQGAGDQGMMFGYASSETKNLMPAPIFYAHRILQKLASIRKSNDVKYLRPDSKSQVSIEYNNGEVIRIHTIVVSQQHTEDFSREQLEDLVKKVVYEVIDNDLLDDDIIYHINPTGKFVIGGPHGDCGLTGRKIIVDTYGGVGSHGGGAFSGKDPSKVDRSAAYMARYIAKNIVGAKLAKKCEVQLSYAIGISQPISVNIDTYNTSKYANEKLVEMIQHVFDLSAFGIISHLKLTKINDEWNYSKSSSYGHFGRDIFPWEQLDKIDEINQFMQ